MNISNLPLKRHTFFESTSCVEEFHSLTAQCMKNHLPWFILNLHHPNITWLPLALVLEGVLDSWSLPPLSTQLLLYACITHPLGCVFHRLKTPSLSSSFYRIISLRLIILTTSVPFPFYYISSDPGQLEPQRAFIRQTQHASMAHRCSQHLQNDVRSWLQKVSRTRLGEKQRNGTVPEPGFGKQLC